MSKERPQYIPKHMKTTSAQRLEVLELESLDMQLDQPVEDDVASVGKSAAMMSVLVIISRLTGFMRTWGQAYALGVTALASCYTIANNLPNQLYELVMGGMLVTAFLPVYLSVKKKQGRRGSNAYASNLLSIVCILMGVMTIVSLIFAGPIVWTQSFGATSDFDSELAVYFFRFFAVEVILYALSSIISGILNAERDYLWSNAAPIFNNIICTSSFLLYAHFMDSNPTLAILLLAVGNPLGVLVQILVQLPSLKRHGIEFSWHVDWHDPALKETLSIGVPSLYVTFISFPTVAVMTSSALSVTAKGASIAYYARLWYVLPYSVFAIPITVAMFTELAEYVANDDMRAFKTGLTGGINQINFLLIPMMLDLILFAPYLITVLAVGKFPIEDILLTSQYLQYLALALPLFGVSTYLQKACSSLRKMVFFAVASTFAAVIQIVFCFVLTPAYGLPAVAFSSALFYLALDIVTLLNLRKKLGSIGIKSMIASIVRSFVFGFIGLGAAWATNKFLISRLGDAVGNMKLSILVLVVGGLVALVSCFGLAFVVKAPETKVLKSVKRK